MAKTPERAVAFPWRIALPVSLAALPLIFLSHELAHTNSFLVFAVAIARTGQWALLALCLTVACTSLKFLLGKRWPVNLRRKVGLTAFAYALLHLLVYAVLGQKLRLDYIAVDTVERLSRPPGWLAFLLLIPLALTSTHASVSRLGFKRWKRLHRLVYVALALGIVHLAWVDAENLTDYARARQYGVAFAGLVLARLVVGWRKGRQQRSG